MTESEQLHGPKPIIESHHHINRTRSEQVTKSNSSLSSLTSQGSHGNSFDDSPRKIMGIKWNQAPGRSRLSRGTKNLLDKWKTHTSRSIDIVGKVNPASTNGSFERKDSREELLSAQKSTWTEHVWSTFIHRGFSDDVTEIEPKMPGKELLTEFQRDKFKYFFYHVLDLNSDHVISAEDFLKLNDRIRHYMDWSVNTIQFLALKEVHDIFKESFLTMAAEIAGSKVKPNHWEPFSKPPDPEPKCCVTVDEWLDVWGNLVANARNIHDLPMWLQYYPKILFDTINRSGTGVITRKELQLFYTAFLDVGKLGEKKIRNITEKAFTAMTSNGDVKLNFHIYKLSFLNFLLGKQPNGPGQFIFGPVAPASGQTIFTVDYSALTVSEEDIETFSAEKLEEKGCRKSIIV